MIILVVDDLVVSIGSSYFIALRCIKIPIVLSVFIFFRIQCRYTPQIVVVIISNILCSSIGRIAAKSSNHTHNILYPIVDFVVRRKRTSFLKTLTNEFLPWFPSFLPSSLSLRSMILELLLTLL
jgi:hypothetical protein